MSYTIYVRMKKLGRQKKQALEPVPFTLETRPQTVRDLLTGLTALGVQQYNAKNEHSPFAESASQPPKSGAISYESGKGASQILRYLTQEEITDQASRGKITLGLHGGNDAVEDKALENTLQCFEDGIYRVFAGEQELTALSDCIPWSEDLVFTFIRLTMLSGW